MDPKYVKNVAYMRAGLNLDFLIDFNILGYLIEFWKDFNPIYS